MTKIRANTLIDHRNRVSEVLVMLTDSRIHEIERRGQMTAQPDGYGNGASGVHTSDVSRPTEAVAMQLIDARPISDPQMTAIRIIDAELKAMATSAKRIKRAAELMDHITDGRRGREDSLHSCQCCQRSDLVDRPKNGYCPGCRSAWIREGRPDRLAFEIHRREQLLDDATPSPA